MFVRNMTSDRAVRALTKTPGTWSSHLIDIPSGTLAVILTELVTEKIEWVRVLTVDGIVGWIYEGEVEAAV